MRVLNFCIGKIQTVQIGTELVRTAHVKAPAAEPWVITPDGPLGDERAVHPDKIYTYARTGYEYWGEYLGVDPRMWPDGFFGENLTLDELDEDDLRIGEILAFGDEVRLAVAGPRNPCAKLSWRLGQPLNFQKIFQRSHRTGVYFSVVRPGTVRPGDTVRRVAGQSTMPSVATVAEFAAGHAVRRRAAHARPRLPQSQPHDSPYPECKAGSGGTRCGTLRRPLAGVALLRGGTCGRRSSRGALPPLTSAGSRWVVHATTGFVRERPAEGSGQQDHNALLEPFIL